MINIQENSIIISGNNNNEFEEIASQTVLEGNLTLLNVDASVNKIKPFALRKIKGNLIVVNCVLSNQLANLVEIEGGVVALGSKIADMKKLKNIKKVCELKNSSIVDLSSLVHIGGDFILNNSYVKNSNVRYIDGKKQIIERPFPEDMKYNEYQF